jgi:hypothetical protein
LLQGSHRARSEHGNKKAIAKITRNKAKRNKQNKTIPKKHVPFHVILALDQVLDDGEPQVLLRLRVARLVGDTLRQFDVNA